jgi:hypothetical protein
MIAEKIKNPNMEDTSKIGMVSIRRPCLMLIATPISPKKIPESIARKGK